MSRSELQRLMRMGTICKICDRKFILRDSYRKYAGEITYYEREKEQLEEQYTIRSQKQAELQAELRHYRELIQLEETKNAQTATDMQLRIEEIELDKNATLAEKDVLTVKMDNRAKEVSTVKQLIIASEIEKE